MAEPPRSPQVASAKPAPPQPASHAAARNAHHKKIRRVPSMLQMEAVECGAAALGMILGYYRRFVTLEELRVACGVSRDGSKAINILKVARSYGLVAAGLRTELEELPSAPLPAIAFWDFGHFVVIEGTSRSGVRINDPASGRRLVTWDEADGRFTGVLLTFEPGDQFKRGGRPSSTYRGLAKRIKGSWSGVWFVVLAGLALVVPLMMAPVITELFIDDVLVPRSPSQFGGLAAALVVAALVQLWLTWWQRTVVNRFNIKLSITTAGGFLRHALRLPLTFYAQRSVGDVAYRLQLGEEVAQVVSNQLTPVLLQTFTAVLYLVLMTALSPPLTLVALVAAAIDVIVLRLAQRQRLEASALVVREESALNATSYYGLRTIESVKASGGEDDLFDKVAGFHAKVTNARQRQEIPFTVVSSLPAMTAQLANIAVLGLGGALILRGQLSIGQLMAITILVAGFLSPIGMLVNLGATMQQAKGNLDRIDDLLRYPTQTQTPTPTPTATSTRPVDTAIAAGEVGKLRGEVELVGVTFGYSPADPPLIRDFSLRLAPGRRVALVGASGSGKTTIARLLTGLVTPWSGQILLDGIALSELSPALLAASLSLVDQDIVLFEGSVRDNIAFMDDTITDEQIMQAARDAAIHDEISTRPGGYSATVADGGGNWSGGQQQRIEIARALATQPSILVLDEATSSLDPSTEQQIDQGLRRRACTTIVVAHRLSTIRDSDEIVVLSHGDVVERGTHDQLLDRGAFYARLVTT